MYGYKKTNYFKHIVLSLMSDGIPRSLKTISHLTFTDVKKFNADVSMYKHYKKTDTMLNTYSTKYTKPILSRKKNGVYHYKITKVGLERLKQMRTAHAIYGVYMLKWHGMYLLIKRPYGNYSVNPEILPYAPMFCDVPMEKLKMYVGLL